MVEVSVTVNIMVGDAEMELRRTANIVQVGNVNGAVRAFMRQAHRAVAGAYADQEPKGYDPGDDDE
jgi:hypothetical protein